MHQIDLCYIVSHGFAARMVIQTDLLGLLADQGLKVGLITPDKKDENLRAYCKKRNVTLYQFPISNSLWTEDYWVRRRYILEDIRSNPALWEKHLKAVNFRSNRSRHPWRHLRPRLYYLLYRLSQRSSTFRSWFLNRESKVLRDEKCSRFLREQVNPALLVSTYPVNLPEAMLLHAGNLEPNVRTAIHLLSWDNITSKGRFPALADEYLVWGDIMAAELKEYYQVPPARIHHCGVPHFDEHIRLQDNTALRAQNLERLGLSANQPYLFFAMSSPYFAPREIDIVEWLAAQVQANSLGTAMQLVVRPHPQNVQGNLADASWLPRLKALVGDRVGVDFPLLSRSKLKWSMKQEDMRNFSSLLSGCTVCFNSGSTVSIDALMVGKPVILTSFDGTEQLPYRDAARRLIDYTHLKKLIALGGVEVVRSYQELRAVTMAYLENPLRRSEERANTIKAQCGELDGAATLRVVEQLSLLLREERAVEAKPTLSQGPKLR